MSEANDTEITGAAVKPDILMRSVILQIVHLVEVIKAV